jgi:hypothetical protein
MKLFKQEEIDEAGFEYLVEQIDTPNLKRAFIAGVEFAEPKVEEIAIEFAKYLFSSKITKYKSISKLEKYIPPEFNLMKGELIKNGNNVFKEFLKQRNE